MHAGWGTEVTVKVKGVACACLIAKFRVMCKIVIVKLCVILLK